VQDFLAQYSPVSRGDYILREGELVATNNEIRNYRIRVNSALQGKVTDSISMNLRFEYDLDNTVIEQSAKADQRIISSIGYAF
jgi:putative salt-induced outer membrane protein YdiY